MPGCRYPASGQRRKYSPDARKRRRLPQVPRPLRPEKAAVRKQPMGRGLTTGAPVRAAATAMGAEAAAQDRRARMGAAGITAAKATAAAILAEAIMAAAR